MGAFDQLRGTVSKSDMVVKGTVSRTERLPSNALIDPDPVPGEWSCTVASLGRPFEWRLHSQGSPVPGFSVPGSFFTTMPWPSGGFVDAVGSTLSFTLNNSALASRPGGSLIRDIYPISDELTPYFPDFQPTQSYEMSRAWRDEYPNVLWWSVKFDVSTGYMELKHSWYCNDKDPSRP